MEYILEKCTNITNENIQEIAKELFYSLSITQEQCEQAIATRSQRDYDMWYKQQIGRLTASSFQLSSSKFWLGKVSSTTG